MYEFRIHGEDQDGVEDSIVITGETLEELRAKALFEESNRKWSNCWSEQLPD